MMLKLEFIKRPTGYYWEIKRDDCVLATHAKPFRSYKAMLDSMVGMLQAVQKDKFDVIDHTGEHRNASLRARRPIGA